MSELPATTDVAIIGGGFAGAATAWALARRGIASIVLEREAELGKFASGRSAGLGRQLVDDDETTALTVRGAQLLRELGGVWRESGGVLTFDNAVDADAYLDRAKRFSVAIEQVATSAVASWWPHLPDLSIAAALHVPSDGVIDIAGLLAALVAGAEAGGAQIARSAGVTAIEPDSVGARLTTALGELEARIVVDASGAWAGRLVGAPPLVALKRHVYVVSGGVVDRAPWLWHLGEQELYVRGAADGVLISPCDGVPVAAGHQEADAEGDAALATRLGNSTLAGAKVLGRWACQRCFTPDLRMRIVSDRTRPWLVWAAGLGGHGATAATAVGERVADVVFQTLNGTLA